MVINLYDLKAEEELMEDERVYEYSFLGVVFDKELDNNGIPGGECIFGGPWWMRNFDVS